jgi:predicted dinucleotide-binding enzyme
MQIAIIGTGNVGAGIAHGLAGKGFGLTLGARDPTVAAVQALASATGASVALPKEAAAQGDIILLALPWSAIEAALRDLGDLTGKIVVDCTNPIARGPQGMGLAVGHSTSGGEMVQGWCPGARVVKTLNQVGAEIMADTGRLSHPPVMFMAGNDSAAKDSVARMLTALGFEALDAGDLAKARLLEPFGMVWINQSILRGMGRDWAFAALPATPR